MHGFRSQYKQGFTWNSTFSNCQYTSQLEIAHETIIYFTTQLRTDETDYIPLVDKVVIIPQSASIECFEYFVRGDDIREGEETFSISFAVENQNDMFSGDFLSVTIPDDGDSKWHAGHDFGEQIKHHKSIYRKYWCTRNDHARNPTNYINFFSTIEFQHLGGGGGGGGGEMYNITQALKYHH